MSTNNQNPTNQTTNRRQFISASAASLTLAAGLANRAYAVGDKPLKIGLIGCGGRGSGAAIQALTADTNTKLTALCDMFDDQLQASRTRLAKSKDVGPRVSVDDDHCFVGFDGYNQMLSTDIDIVLIATPPHFRPMHLRAAIDAGKHVFAEKPVAVDPAGVRSVLETTELAKQRNLSLVSGLCWRYETNTLKLIDQLHSGAIGDVVAMQATRFGGGVGKLAIRQPQWSEMEFQLRNWYYYTWLSGDFNVEQFVHEMDRMAWVMNGEYPESCTSTGGRQTRIEPKYGHINDHFSTIFTYKSGARLYGATRHQKGCSNASDMIVMGSKGQANMNTWTITGDNPYAPPRRTARTNMHQLEHDAMYAALRRGEIINNGEYMAKSTMMAIMARMAAYTGKEITWDQAMNSKLDLSPSAYNMHGTPPPAEIAMPGITKFI